MNCYYLEFLLYLICLSGALFAGAYRWRNIDAPSRIIVFSLGLGLTTELVGFYAAKVYRNNMPVYNVASLFLVLLVIRYYQYHLEYLKRKGVALLFYVVSALTWLASTISKGSLFGENMIFTDYEILMVVVLSVVMVDRMVQRSYSGDLRQNPHFYFVVLFVLFRGASFVQWNLYEYLTRQHPMTKPIIDFGLWAGALLLHLGIGLVFVLYPKIKYVKS